MKRRSGFTLIEVLVTIGIIMVLVGILVMGYRHLNQAAAKRETGAELQLAAGLLKEYEGRNGLKGIEFFSTTTPRQTLDPSGPSFSSNPNPNLSAGFPVFVDPWPSLNTTTTSGANSNTLAYSSGGTIGAYWPCLRLDAAVDDIAMPASGTPADSDMGDKSSLTNSPRYASSAVQATQEVMYVLSQIPANRTTLLGVQSKRTLEMGPNQSPWMTVGSPSTSPPIPPTLMQPPPVVLLDGWGNPIIFVPRGGMHVFIKNPSTNANDTYLVRSTGTTLIQPNAADPPLTGAERPFFASAGQDGDFTQGEDNVYSFAP